MVNLFATFDHENIRCCFLESLLWRSQVSHYKLGDHKGLLGILEGEHFIMIVQDWELLLYIIERYI